MLCRDGGQSPTSIARSSLRRFGGSTFAAAGRRPSTLDISMSVRTDSGGRTAPFRSARPAPRRCRSRSGRSHYPRDKVRHATAGPTAWHDNRCPFRLCRPTRCTPWYTAHMIRGLATAFPILRPGLFLSDSGRRSCRPQSGQRTFPCRCPASANARVGVRWLL